MRSLAALFSPVKSTSKLTSEAASTINKKRCSLNYTEEEEEKPSSNNDAQSISTDKSRITKKRLCLRPSTYTPPPRRNAPPPPSSSTTDTSLTTLPSTAKKGETKLTPTWRINVGIVKTSPITLSNTNSNKRKCADCAVGITIGDNCTKCSKLNMIIESQQKQQQKKAINKKNKTAEGNSEKIEVKSVELKADNEGKEEKGVGIEDEVVAQTPASMKSKGSKVARTSSTQEGDDAAAAAAATTNSSEVKKSPLFSMTAGVVVTNSRTRNPNRTSAVPSSPPNIGNNGGTATVVATRTSPRRLKSFNPPPTPRCTEDFTSTQHQQPPPCTTPRTSNNSSNSIMAPPNSLQTPRTPGGSHPYAKMGILSHPNSLQTPRTPRTPGMDELALFNWGPDELGAAQSWEEELLGGATADPSSSSSSMAAGSLRNVSSIMSPGGLKWSGKGGASSSSGGGLSSKSNTVTFAPLKTEEEDLKSPAKISLGKRGKAGKSLDVLAASAERKKKAATPIKKKKKKKRSVNFDSDEDVLDSDNDEEEDYPSSKEDDDDYEPTPTKKKKSGTTRIKIKATTTATKKSSPKPPVATTTTTKKKVGRGRPKGSKTQKEEKKKLVKKQRYVKTGSSEKISRTVKTMAPPTYAGVSKKALKNNKVFSLHREGDEEHINQVHILVRRDIWEGFVVGANEKSEDRSESRLVRYNNTVGFRCKWCKHVKPDERADKAAVYPRRLDRIYLSNIRFQRDHIV